MDTQHAPNSALETTDSLACWEARGLLSSPQPQAHLCPSKWFRHAGLTVKHAVTPTQGAACGSAQSELRHRAKDSCKHDHPCACLYTCAVDTCVCVCVITRATRWQT
eukprot:GHVU01227981.1.p1 GENE.GHVU01227981.1~~GHVU01227981.1.p1  ORF type:complete len:107 (+),score=1.25 GHVU01227981.1:416-736(+)